MVTRTHVTLEETVGEFVVSLHLPVGLSFDVARQIIQGMDHAIQAMMKRSQEEQQAHQDVPVTEHVEDVTQA